MKYPFLFVFAVALLGTLVFMMLTRAVAAELGILLDRKRLSGR